MQLVIILLHLLFLSALISSCNGRADFQIFIHRESSIADSSTCLLVRSALRTQLNVTVLATSGLKKSNVGLLEGSRFMLSFLQESKMSYDVSHILVYIDGDAVVQETNSSDLARALRSVAYSPSAVVFGITGNNIVNTRAWVATFQV